MPRVFSLPASRPHLMLDVKFTVGLPTSLFSHLLDRAAPSPSCPTGISGIAEIYTMRSPVASPIHPQEQHEAPTCGRDPYLDPSGWVHWDCQSLVHSVLVMAECEIKID